MDEDCYILKMYPTNLFSTTPAAKLQEVLEMMEVGMISQDQGLDLLDFPDLEKFISSRTAKVDDIMATIDEIVYEGKYTPPEPFQDLQFGVEMFQSSYLKFKRRKVPEANLELLRTWIGEALEMLNPEPNQAMMEDAAAVAGEAQQQGQEQGAMMQGIQSDLEGAGVQPGRLTNL